VREAGVKHEFTAGFLFCGLGAGARGFIEAAGRLGTDVATFRSVGGVDVDDESCVDFERLTGSPALRADVSQLTPGELRAAWGLRAPDCVFLSPPCKGFSGLLSAKSAAAPKYQALNRLVLQGVFLLCETWPDGPPGLIVLENVPRIVSRGAVLLGQVKDLLARYGYRFDERQHDCGELGGLGQHRRRYLLVARRPKAVPAFVYRPPKQRVKGCGEVLEQLHMPEDPAAGPLHRLPRLAWRTWVRLALIPAGGDWRDLPGVVQAGHQRRSVWARHDVRAWDQAARTVAGEGSNGGFAVADPRVGELGAYRGSLGVVDWETPAPCVRGAANVRTGPAAVADPRLGELLALPPSPGRHWNKFRVSDWERPAGAVIGSDRVGSGAPCVADPRLEQLGLGRTAENAASFKGRPGLYGVNDWAAPAPAVTGSASVTGSNGVAAVADPRLGCTPRSGAYGVLSWEEAAGTITGAASVDNGRFAVADPRMPGDVTPVILAADGTWHRPMSTLDLAALQGLPAELDGAPLTLAGTSVARWRERIGNAVPVQAATAIAQSLLVALLAGKLGTWFLSNEGVWVREDGRAEHEWAVEASA